MSLPEDFIVAGAVGLGMAVHDNTNQRMINQGIQPSWRRRHPILVVLLWSLFWIPVVIGVVMTGPYLLFGVAQFDVHHGNTGLIDIAVYGSPLYIWGILAYRRAERRWRVPAGQPRTVEIQRWEP